MKCQAEILAKELAGDPDHGIKILYHYQETGVIDDFVRVNENLIFYLLADLSMLRLTLLPDRVVEAQWMDKEQTYTYLLELKNAKPS